MLSVFGFCVFAALFGGMLRANARRWRYLATRYAGAADRPLQTRKLQSAVLLGLGGFNSIKGILTIGVHETGVSLRILAPFSLFHTPLFIPYREIQGWGASWYLDAASTELAICNAPEVKIIMPAEQAEWIRRHAGHQMQLSKAKPPEGNSGRGWRAFALVHAAISLAMIAWLSVHLLMR